MTGASVANGQCYCGATTVSASCAPDTVAYCHCKDCRRATGAPVAAVAAFAEDAVSYNGPTPGIVSLKPGATRMFCATCGSPVGSRFDYLPGQVYIPLGLLDQADTYAPQVHCYESERLAWLNIEDTLERFDTTGRTALNGSAFQDTHVNMDRQD